jgi:hydroxymethylglutaryl-CoA lyase
VGKETGHSVIITDVTLREYGQNIPSKYLHIFTPQIRVEIALRLIKAGFTQLEIFSCVHPKVAPAMNKEALNKISKDLGWLDGIHFITLVPNKKGYENFMAMSLGPDGYEHTMGAFFSAVEAHNRANLGRSISETVQEYTPIIKDAVAKNTRVVGYVSAAFGYAESENGVVLKPDQDDLNEYIDFYLDLGAESVTLSDLQGIADQDETGRVFETIINKRKGRDVEKLGYHPHHISGEKAIANSKVAYDLGIRRFDASLGGTGGCVTGAPGNQPTEALVHFMNESGVETGINEAEVFFLSETVQKELYSRINLL